MARDAQFEIRVSFPVQIVDSMLTSSLTLFLVGVGIPILLTALSYLPYAASLSHWLKVRYIYPTLASRHIQPMHRVFHIPTLGQSIFLAFFVIMTVVFTAVEYGSVSPNTWFTSTYFETMSYVANRTGALSIALMPLTILLAGRNNILLWLSNWSHSTYLLIHRWVARLCLLQLVLHSILELVARVQNGSYPTELPKLYWVWGCVGTVAAVIMVVAAQFRNTTTRSSSSPTSSSRSSSSLERGIISSTSTSGSSRTSTGSTCAAPSGSLTESSGWAGCSRSGSSRRC